VPAQPQTAEEFLRLIERSGLMSSEAVQQKLAGKQLPKEPVPLAKMLVKGGVLTTFQADQLLQGRTRGFFLGNYRVLQHLGGGATAGVFLCEHRVMRNRVAVKVLSQNLVNEDENNVQRFRREAQAAAALSHPNIVRTIDFDEDNGRYFLVMEHVEGVTLDQWLKRHPTAPVRTLVQFILQAALGLQHIHLSGLIHRDLKPNNLFLDKQGTVKILDLGLAKFTDDRNDSLSRLQGSHIRGTVDFMSPEQADGSVEVDIRADIYSLGATLYYMLTGGHVPFEAESIGAKMIAIQLQEPKPIREFNPHVDPALQKLVEKMMAKDADKRFQLPKDVIEALQGWVSRSSKKMQAVKDGPPSIKIAKPSALKAPIAQAAKPDAEKHIPLTHKKWFAWALRLTALIIIVSGLAIIKPWGSNNKATAQTPPAAPK
jgi:eukaryotic-like serine/threonine-protein kinase